MANLPLCSYKLRLCLKISMFGYFLNDCHESIMISKNSCLCQICDVKYDKRIVRFYVHNWGKVGVPPSVCFFSHLHVPRVTTSLNSHHSGFISHDSLKMSHNSQIKPRCHISRDSQLTVHKALYMDHGSRITVHG